MTLLPAAQNMVPRMQLLSPAAAVRSCALVLLLLLAGVDATTFRIGVLGTITPLACGHWTRHRRSACCANASGEPSLTHTAKRGSARALEQWSPTFTTYLNQQLPHHNFITVPLGFNEVFPAVAQKDVDFLYNTAPTLLIQASKHSHTSTVCCTALPTRPTLPVWSESLASPRLPQWSTTGAA